MTEAEAASYVLGEEIHYQYVVEYITVIGACADTHTHSLPTQQQLLSDSHCFPTRV